MLMKWSARRNLIIALVMLMPLIESCSYIGPNSVNNDRRRYNEVLQATNDEELLLNLVRMRYSDTPSFVNVNSITSQLSVSASTSATHSQTGNSIGLAISSITKSLTPSFSISESPVISYAPLQGDQYVREFITPLNSNLFALLGASGWPMNATLKLVLTRMNDVWNAPSASRPSPKTAPNFEQFDELLFNLDKMGHGVQLGYSVIGKQSLPSLRFEPGVLETPPGKNVTRILGLAPGMNVFALLANDWAKKKGVINIQTRSVLGTLYLLSHNVDVPAEHVDRGWVGKTLKSDGTDFDWDLVTKGLFKVRVGSEKPSDSDIAVEYRNKWFSIARNDLNTKMVFTMLSQLLSLQSGTSDVKAPALTIPLN
jgi:hypothetical protein